MSSFYLVLSFILWDPFASSYRVHSDNKFQWYCTLLLSLPSILFYTHEIDHEVNISCLLSVGWPSSDGVQSSKTLADDDNCCWSNIIVGPHSCDTVRAEYVFPSFSFLSRRTVATARLFRITVQPSSQRDDLQSDCVQFQAVSRNTS